MRLLLNLQHGSPHSASSSSRCGRWAREKYYPAGLTQQQLNDAIAELRSQMLTREQVQRIVRDMLAQQPADQRRRLSSSDAPAPGR